MGVKTVYIDTIRDLSLILFDHPFDETVSRNRDMYLYRGLPDPTFSLITSLKRICKQKFRENEMDILDNFARYAELEDATISRSIWRKMILGQHHGLPTRLLDWTRSPLIALNFAMTEGDMDNLDRRDCVVWRIDAARLHEYLPQKYKDYCEKKGRTIFSVDMLHEVCDSLEQYDEDMGSDKMLILEPPSMDARMMNQYSFFSVMPSAAVSADEILEQYEDVAVRFIINRNCRWEIRDFLDHANINERIVYPGLDGIAQWISRSYYVRNTCRLHIEKQDITKINVDVIVNAANTAMENKGTVRRAVFQAAGEEQIASACSVLAPLSPGSIAVTDGFGLKVRKIIHANIPEWNISKRSENDPMLISIYRQVLNYVVENNYHSIAFPLLAAGHIGYPVDMAWMMSLRECVHFMKQHQGYPLDITFCVLSEEMYAVGEYFLKQANGIAATKEEIDSLRILLQTQK